MSLFQACRSASTGSILLFLYKNSRLVKAVARRPEMAKRTGGAMPAAEFFPLADGDDPEPLKKINVS
jgi:hypothetical protein